MLKIFKKKIIPFIEKGKIIKGIIIRTFSKPSLPQNEQGKIYVNLGCGSNSSSEFINIDARKMPGVHYIAEIQRLPQFKNNSVDLLYASHVVEHISRPELIKTLTEWHRVLKVDGVLRFGVPHFDALIQIYNLSQRDVHSIVNQLMGQNPPYDDHHTIWNFAYASEVLKSVGFKEIRMWDVSKVEHHAFNDKTNRVVEIAGKKIPISLNIEAIK